MKLAKKKEKQRELALLVYSNILKSSTHHDTLSSVLTKEEKIVIGRRLLIAYAILNGTTRRELQDKLGISPNTFAQVNNWLRNELQEYNAFTNSSASQTDKVLNRTKYVRPFSYEHLKKSYPAHFLLFSIAENVWKTYVK